MNLFHLLGRILFRVFSALVLLAVIVTLVMAIAMGVLYFTRGSARPNREGVFFAYAIGAFAGSLALAWVCARWRRRSDVGAVSYQRLSTRATDRLNNLVFSVFTIILVLVAFLNAKGSRLEKTLQAVLAVGLFFFGIHLLIFVHELGHLLAGWFAGLQLQKLQVGSGRLILRRMTSQGFIWEWRVMPAGGLVIGWPNGSAPARARQWFFVIGGPSASLLAALLLALVFGHNLMHPAPSHRFSALDVAGEFLLLFAVGIGLGALMPYTVHFSGMQIQSDGLRLISLLLPSKISAEDGLWALRWRQILYFWASHQRKRAWSILRNSMEQDPELRDRLEFAKGWLHLWDEGFSQAIASFEAVQANDAVPEPLRLSARAHRAFALAGVGRFEEARASISIVLESCGEVFKTDFLDLFSWIPSVCGVGELVGEAVAWNAEAIRISPKLARLRATEAALLAEGNDAKAEIALRTIFLDHSQEETDRGIAAFYLARLLRQRGATFAEIGRCKKRAAEWCPHPWPLRRIRAELEG